MGKKAKVLCLFDYKCHTGFSTVSTNIKTELKKHFSDDLQLDIIAINYFGDPIMEDDGTFVISALKSATKKDNYGRMGFLKILKDSDEYDAIFIIEDLGVIVPIIEVLKFIKIGKIKEKKKVFKSFVYSVADCKLTPNFVENLEFFDYVYTFTDYSKNQMVELNPKLKDSIGVIPNGINIKDFHVISLDEKLKFRNEYFGENSNKIIFSNINRNQPRKHIPTTIFSFIDAKREWESKNYGKDLFLYLHCNPKDPVGWDLKRVLAQTELIEGKDYKLLDEAYWENGTSKEMLNNIYNASDVYITTTLGEGWGLTFLEAAATKTPIIAPYSTSFIEMSDYGKRAYMVEELNPFVGTNDNMIREQVNYKEFSKVMVYISEGLIGKITYFEELNQNMIDMAHNWATTLDWTNVGKTWIKSFDKLYK
jgi:glycosyltransferase involved in cell wall biosynthesis